MSRHHDEATREVRARQSPREATRCLAVAITAVGIGFLANPVAALAEPLHISIARQPLASALQQLARQADIQILYSRELVDGRTAPALTGDFELQSALNAILADSGLTYAFAGNDSVVIKAETAPGSSPHSASDPPAAGAHDTGGSGSAAPLSASNDLAIQEVVVTARKREESLQNTPIAVWRSRRTISEPRHHGHLADRTVCPGPFHRRDLALRGNEFGGRRLHPRHRHQRLGAASRPGRRNLSRWRLHLALDRRRARPRGSRTGRGAARAPGDPVRPEHHRWRDQHHVEEAGHGLSAW